MEICISYQIETLEKELIENKRFLTEINNALEYCQNQLYKYLTSFKNTANFKNFSTYEKYSKDKLDSIVYYNSERIKTKDKIKRIEFKLVNLYN